MLMATRRGLELAAAVTRVLTSIVGHTENTAAEAGATCVVSTGKNKGNVVVVFNMLAHPIPTRHWEERPRRQTGQSHTLLAARAHVLVTSGIILAQSSQQLQTALGAPLRQ